MKKMLRSTLCFALAFMLSFTLSGCTRQIKNSADELTLHSWSAQLENGNTIDLSFSDDNATLMLTVKDNDPVTLSGFCEISDSEFVIHDSAFGVYPFSYIVHFDRVELTYDSNTVSLNKST